MLEEAFLWVKLTDFFREIISYGDPSSIEENSQNEVIREVILSAAVLQTLNRKLTGDKQKLDIEDIVKDNIMRTDEGKRKLYLLRRKRKELRKRKKKLKNMGKV
jgi:hypothetical protein